MHSSDACVHALGEIVEAKSIKDGDDSFIKRQVAEGIRQLLEGAADACSVLRRRLPCIEPKSLVLLLDSIVPRDAFSERDAQLIANGRIEVLEIDHVTGECLRQ